MPASSPHISSASSRFFRLLAIGLLATGCSWLEPAEAHADNQIWVLASLTKTVAVDWRVTFEVAPRWERDASDYSRTILRTQLARALGHGVLVAGGYEFQEPASFVTRREHRLWQQVQVQQHTGAWTLMHRGRVEERWLHLAPSTVVRLRYQIRATRPIAHSRQWSWLMLDELFYTARGSRLGPAQGFDRNRLGGGIARALTPHVSVETGYTWQFINRQPPLPDQHDQLVAFNLLARY